MFCELLTFHSHNNFLSILQRVYGVTTATVRVGYEYRDCGNSFDGLVWHIETTKMSGHDLASTDIGGWNLHVQHKYNFHSGILQKGDGNTIYLKYKPQVRIFFDSASNSLTKYYFQNLNSLYGDELENSPK